MNLHVLFVDDEEEVLESLVPGVAQELGRRLLADPAVQSANAAAGYPLPKSGRLDVKVTASGYQSQKLPHYVYRSPAAMHLHLCCERGGSFRHALRQLKEHFVAVVVSDLRFADDALGARAGRIFIEDVHRRNPETYGILYSAYQKPEGFPAERFIRKGAEANLGGGELLTRIVQGVAHYLSQPGVKRFARAIRQRGLVYQSDAFGATLRRLYDYAAMHFGPEADVDPEAPTRRRPRPTLLLDGETGTGKTELASLLHEISDRRHFPFHNATCSQLTNEVFLRSTLFGHVKGSFTDARADRPGLVAAAGKGILLLDDLHAITEEGSVILHSFLDDGDYARLGDDENRRQAQVAIVAAAETPRWAEIKAERQLPESFIHRVEQLVLRIPPLRERPDDIAAQAQAYCADHCAKLNDEMELSPDALQWLVEFGFPHGNSRKLRDFLKGVVSANAKVTDYLDVPELEEYAAETGLLGKRPPTAVGGAAGRIGIAAEAPSAGADWPGESRDPANWPGRIGRLAIRALEGQFQLDTTTATTVGRALFEEHFPRLWEEFRALTQAHGAGTPMDIKLFDELFRYYVIFRAGNPARAAKELGMKDNALREFVYSREQKRDLPPRGE